MSLQAVPPLSSLAELMLRMSHGPSALGQQQQQRQQLQPAFPPADSSILAPHQSPGITLQGQGDFGSSTAMMSQGFGSTTTMGQGLGSTTTLGQGLWYSSDLSQAGASGEVRRAGRALAELQRAGLALVASRSPGPHQHIPHPDLRSLWHRCCSPLAELDLATWWQVCVRLCMGVVYWCGVGGPGVSGVGWVGRGSRGL